MASDLQISANRANSMLSTGPSLAARAHTRYNGLKTGIRFRGEFLPAERPEEFHERIAVWTQALKPRNAGERELVFKYVRAEWVHARAERAIGARIYTQHKQAGDCEDDGVDKNLRLLYWDRRGPHCMYALSNPVSDRLQTSWSPEVDDPLEPSLVLKALESSAKGCEKLIGEWKTLASRIERGLPWQPHDRLKSIRLMARQPLDIMEDKRVLLVYVATFAMNPLGRTSAFEDLRCDMGATEYDRFVNRIRTQEERAPVSGSDPHGAQLALLDMVARNVECLEAKLEVHRAHEEEKAELASDRLGSAESAEGERLQRHLEACARQVARCLDAFWKYRRLAGDVEDDGADECLGLEEGAAAVGAEHESVTTEANLGPDGGEERAASAGANKNVTTEANLESSVPEVKAAEAVEVPAVKADGGVLGAVRPNSTRSLGHAADARIVEEAIRARGALLRPID